MAEYRMGEIMLSEEAIQTRTMELGKAITESYRGEDLIAVCVLKGAFIFMSDLIRHIDLDVSVDFMAVSSYGDSTSTSGIVRILKDLDSSIEGKNILIVEDIVDSGVTLSYLKNYLLNRNPKSLKICTLLDKPERRESEIDVDFVGFSVENKFIVGYGLDYQERYRNLPYIACLEQA